MGILDEEIKVNVSKQLWQNLTVREFNEECVGQSSCFGKLVLRTLAWIINEEGESVIEEGKFSQSAWDKTMKKNFEKLFKEWVLIDIPEIILNVLREFTYSRVTGYNIVELLQNILFEMCLLDTSIYKSKFKLEDTYALEINKKRSGVELKLSTKEEYLFGSLEL